MSHRRPPYDVAVAMLVVATAVLSSGCASSTNSDKRDGRSSTPATFRIATYNINFGNQRLDLVVEAIRESGADVVALQEVTEWSERYLLEHLGTLYPHVAFQGRPGPYAAQGFGLLSKQPITRADHVPPEHGLFGMQIAEVKLGRRRVRVVNVHLQPVPVFQARGPRDLLKAVQEAESIHRAEIVWIHDAAAGKSGLDPGAPTVILGDFNSMSAFAAPTFLRAHGFTDSFAAVTADADEQPSWEWPTRAGLLRARIDYIWHNEAIRTTASRVIRNDSSDHFLVVSELEFDTATE